MTIKGSPPSHTRSIRLYTISVPRNALAPIYSTPAGMVKLSTLQFLKALSPMDFNVEGRLISDKSRALANALSPMVSRPSGSVTFFKLTTGAVLG